MTSPTATAEIERLVTKIEYRLKHASPTDCAYEQPMTWDEAWSLIAALRAAEAERDRMRGLLHRAMNTGIFPHGVLDELSATRQSTSAKEGE